MQVPSPSFNSPSASMTQQEKENHVRNFIKRLTRESWSEEIQHSLQEIISLGYVCQKTKVSEKHGCTKKREGDTWVDQLFRKKRLPAI